MKIAVTAANGQLGGAIIAECKARIGPDQVIGLARTPAKAAHLGVEIRPGDYEAPVDLERSLRGVDAVLLVSGMDEPSKRIGQHRNVINAAKAAGVRKIVYTSVQGAEEGTSFSPVVQSNRQTERDVRESGLAWVIGRDGIYIEPDVEYIEAYKQMGAIRNSAGEGRCAYTTRLELANAYAHLLTEEQHHGRVYNLSGEPITQRQLADYLNLAFGTKLTYEPMSVEAYREDRIAEMGEFLGSIIAGIYQSIRDGKLDNPSHYREAAGRPHVAWDSYFRNLRADQRR